MATAQRTANVQAIYNAILLSPAYFSFPIETCNIPAVAGPLSPATGAPRDTFSLTFTETAKFWRWDAEFESHIYASFIIPIALADTLRGFCPDGTLVRAGLLHSCATNQQASLRRGGKAEVVVRLNSDLGVATVGAYKIVIGSPIAVDGVPDLVVAYRCEKKGCKNMVHDNQQCDYHPFMRV